jgi:hypothetical protein
MFAQVNRDLVPIKAHFFLYNAGKYIYVYFNYLYSAFGEIKYYSIILLNYGYYKNINKCQVSFILKMKIYF